MVPNLSPAAATAPIQRSAGLRFSARLGILAAIFIAEMLAVSLWLDGDMLRGNHGLLAVLHDWGAWSVRLAVASVLAFLILGESRSEASPAFDPGQWMERGIQWPLLLGHAAAMGIFFALSAIVFAQHPSGFLPNFEVVAWAATGVAAIVLAACAVIPARVWIAKIRSMRDMLIFAPAAGLAAVVLGTYARRFWDPLSHVTFAVVGALLRPFLTLQVSDPATSTIGSAKFSVQIAPECSGYEGMGLILALTCAWLWFLRKQWRFPQALLLIPLGVGAVWTLNAVRIAALILIGHAGAPRIAFGGFHSQAGWIAFSFVALGICAGARRVSWLAAGGHSQVEVSADAANPTVPYLMPFLAIMGAALIARAASSDFEWLYPLRVVAAIAVLWYFRRSYRAIDWHFGPAALVAGLAIFGLWIGLDRLYGVVSSAAPASFQQASRGMQGMWILFRVIGAVITVPIAEELAFRGFLLRRLSNADFESVSFRTLAWMPVLISSLAFGILHGERWIAGMIAGAVYALVMIRRGRIGDAIAAHAFTNALLAAWVLATGNWQLW